MKHSSVQSSRYNFRRGRQTTLHSNGLALIHETKSNVTRTYYQLAQPNLQGIKRGLAAIDEVPPSVTDSRQYAQQVVIGITVELCFVAEREAEFEIGRLKQVSCWSTVGLCTRWSQPAASSPPCPGRAPGMTSTGLSLSGQSIPRHARAPLHRSSRRSA